MAQDVYRLDTEPGSGEDGSPAESADSVPRSGLEPGALGGGWDEAGGAFEGEHNGVSSGQESSVQETSGGVATLEIDPSLMARALEYFPEDIDQEVESSPQSTTEVETIPEGLPRADPPSPKSPPLGPKETGEDEGGARTRARRKDKRGRPRKNDPLRNRRYVYFTDDEAALVSAKAEADSRKISSYIRSRVLAQQVASEGELSDLMTMLIRARKAVIEEGGRGPVASLQGQSAMPYPTYQAPGAETERDVDLEAIAGHLEMAQALVVEMMKRAAALTERDDS